MLEVLSNHTEVGEICDFYFRDNKLSQEEFELLDIRREIIREKV